MKIMLLCSSFNGLSQRVWLELRSGGVDVAVEVGGGAERIEAAATSFDPDLIVCPFLRERLPASVWNRWRTIIFHPGPVGDRGASSLDWAITEGAALWGVTALQAVEELDAGPVWATRAFPLPDTPQPKRDLYNELVADAAVELVRDVVARASDPAFVPRAVEDGDRSVPGRPRPLMRQSDRSFSWSDGTDHIVRRVRAADGSPGVRTHLGGKAVMVFDAHPGPPWTTGEPGDVIARRHGAVLVRTGDRTVWIGQARPVRAGTGSGVKLPATAALADVLAGVPELSRPVGRAREEVRFREIEFRRHGPVGVLSFDFYNGAMSTGDCRRLAVAVRRAAASDTRVLVLRGGRTFSNGIHLNVIDAAVDPAAEAWRNLNAINDVCREIITCTRRLVVSAVAGNAGAGGVMLALGADRVLLRDGVVLNPHYRTMGLYGSEYWTYVLPRRVGNDQADRLTQDCLPVSAAEAVSLGLADAIAPVSYEDFDEAVLEYAATVADADFGRCLQAKREKRADDEACRPLDAYRGHELAEMSRDVHGDRHGFSAARRAFVTKQPLPGGPDLAEDRSRRSTYPQPSPPTSQRRAGGLSS